jgi:hypothetical protein
VKVSTLLDIGQHKRYFTDCRNQNKSTQKVRKFQLCFVLDNTILDNIEDILSITRTASWERHGKPSLLCLLQKRNVGMDS